MARTVDAERQRQVFERLEGLMAPEDVALARIPDSQGLGGAAGR